MFTCNTVCVPLIHVCILLSFPFPSFPIFPFSPSVFSPVVVTLLPGGGSSTAHIWGPWRPQCCQKGTHTNRHCGEVRSRIVFPVHMYMLWRCVYTHSCVSAYTTFYEPSGFLIYFMCEFRPLGVGGELVSHKRSSTHSLRCPVCCVYIYMFVLFVYSTCPCRVGVGFLSLLSVPLN